MSLGKAWEGEASRFYSSLLVKSEGDSESAVYSSRASQKCVTIANTTRSLSFPCVTLFIFLLLVPECVNVYCNMLCDAWSLNIVLQTV